MRLWFGLYAGFDTSDSSVPVSYLKWLEEQKWVKQDLRDDLNQEIARRVGDRPGTGKVVKK